MKRILIIDDNNEHREILQEVLSYSDFEVKGLIDGKGIFKEIFIFKPNLLIIDYILPGENGVQLCKKIKTNIETMTLPIILVSAYLGVLEYFNCCDWVMCKPLDLETLINKINDLLLEDKLLAQEVNS